MREFDFVAIGGGSAGYAAASLVAKAGFKVAVIEGGETVGGLCILRGCIPSKTLLATAANASAVRSAHHYGVKAAFQGVDGHFMQARKRLLIDDFAGYRRGQLESGRFTFLRGRAQFIDTHTVSVKTNNADHTIRGRTFLISTGSVISMPPIPGLDAVGYLDSDGMLESAKIPESVTVLGGGAIALEAASFYAGVGSRVTLIQRSSRVLKNLDPDVSEAVMEAMRKQGIRIETGVEVRACRADPTGKVVQCARASGVFDVVSAEIVSALGRVPATSGMGLSSAGVAIEGARVHINQTQQTSAPHIFAAGDVCGPLEVVHLAIQQGEVAARNACRLMSASNEPLEQMNYDLKLIAVFSEPAVASVGLSEAEASLAGIPFLSASYPFGDHGKSMVEGHTDGFVKLVVHADTRRIIGAAVVGPQAAEIIHEIVVAMHFKATAGELAKVPHYHPTLSESWTYPAEDLSE